MCPPVEHPNPRETPPCIFRKKGLWPFGLVLASFISTTALSRQEISFLRRYSLKRPYPLKKETLALNSTISRIPGETKYDGFGPFSRFFRPRAPPRPRATPATGPPPPPGPGTVARRPGRARAARGGSPRGEKGPFFQLLGLGLANKCPKRRRRRAPACCWRRATAKMVPGVQLPGSRARSSPRQRQCRRRRRVL